MLSLECALKRSPVVRAKRKCAFQRSALPSPGAELVAACSDSPAATDDLSWPSSPRWLGQLAEVARRVFLSDPSALLKPFPLPRSTPPMPPRPPHTPRPC